jgi:RsiW-degrading membrane proteinase PrsW (M82 family)
MLIAQALHWSLALVPVLLLLTVFLSFDAFKLMSLGEIMLLLVLGGLAAAASYPISGRLLDTLPIGVTDYSRYWAPWIEEAVKGAVVVALFRFNRIGFKVDAVLSGFAIGAGFSLIENIIYLVRMPDHGAGTWLVRGLGTAVMHGTTLAILAATAHECAERGIRGTAATFRFNLLWFVPGYLAAGALHMAFNQFPNQPLLAMLGASMIAPLAILSIFRFGTAEAQDWLETEQTRHRIELSALCAGRWPDGPTGTRVAAFAALSGKGSAERIRRYWELQAFLVVEAEETLIEEASGDAAFDREAVGRALDELVTLERALGRSRTARLKRLLPFSRNDLWEISELKQRLSSDTPNRQVSAGPVERFPPASGIPRTQL